MAWAVSRFFVGGRLEAGCYGKSHQFNFVVSRPANWVFLNSSLSSMASDLTPEYLATLRRMTGQEKLRSAFNLYWSARKMKAAGLRAQHPDWAEEQIQKKVKEIFLHAVT